MWLLSGLLVPLHAQLVVTEFMASNASGLVDEDGDFSDWVEIHNPTAGPVDLSGWRLSDDIAAPEKWVFPAGTSMGADSYIVVRASGKNRAVAGSELHANFKLTASGGVLLLTPPAGGQIGDRVLYGQQFADVAYGKGNSALASESLRGLVYGYLMEASPGAENPSRAVANPVFPDDRLPQYDVTISNSAWQSLFNDRWNDYDRPCKVRYRAGDVDVELAGCGISPVGNSSRNHERMSMMLSFNAFVSGQNLLGVEKVRLRGESNDPSSMRSKLLTEMLQAAGVPVAEENFAAMVVQIENGPRFLMAVYQAYEHYDEGYLERMFPGAQGNLYKCLYPADLTYRAAGDYGSVLNYRADGQPRPAYDLVQQGAGQPADYTDFADFVDVLNNTPNADFAVEIDKVLDVDLFLRAIAVTALAGHWDDYVYNNNNYNLYHDVRRGKWVYLPIDYDNTFGVDWTGVDWSQRDIMNWGSSGKPLAQRILAVPEYRERYAHYVSRFMNEFFVPAQDVMSGWVGVHISPMPYYTRFGNPVTNAAFQDRNNEHYNRDDWTGSGERGINFETFSNGVWGDSSLDNLGGWQVKQGIVEYLTARAASAAGDLPGSIDPAPIIGDIKLRNTVARVGEDLVFEMRVEDDANAIPAVSFHYRVDGGAWQVLALSDDGLGNDVAAADGFYTATVPAFSTAGGLEYYVSATDGSAQTATAPWGGASAALLLQVGSELTGLRFSEVHYHPYEPDRVLLNEVSINPTYTDAPYEFFEILTTRGQRALDGFYLVVINGDQENNPGKVVFAKSLAGVTTGANGLLLVKATSGGHAAEDAATAVLTTPALASGGSGIPNGSITVALVESPVVALALNDDLDANNDGVLELPAHAGLKDVVSISDQGAGDRHYGGVVVPSASTDSPDAIVRRSGQWDAAGGEWYYGQLGNSSSTKNFNFGAPDHNVPSGGVLTPGAANLPAGYSDTDYEFVELLNTTGTAMDLSGVQISGGISFSFPAGTSLAAGGRVVVAENVAAFAQRYGLSAAGEYSGKLSNSGEQIVLSDAGGGLIEELTYADSGAWPGRPDGEGFSLERVDFAVDASQPSAWGASEDFHGTPAVAASPVPTGVVINEVLANPVSPGLEQIEIHNASPVSVDLGGWLLGDGKNRYFRYAFANGQMIPAGGYLVLTSEGFHPAAADPRVEHFTLNDYEGESLYLFAPPDHSAGAVLCDKFSFGATAPGESIGRLPNGSGRIVPLASTSFGAANVEARVGPLVISEVMYHPADGVGVHEFVEIHNPTASAVALEDWQVAGGVDFTFAAGVVIGAGETLVVLPFDPANATLLADFEAYYGIASGGHFVGPFAGVLDNAGECVRLLRPGTPEPEAPAVVPLWLEDEVCYEPLLPWPVAADGAGYSLTRTGFAQQGNAAASWQGDVPSPGAVVQVHLSITASVPGAAEYPLSAGEFVVGRQVATAEPEVVEFVISAASTAENGVDFVAIPMSVAIAAGEQYATVEILPLADELAEGVETLTLELVAQPGQALLADSSATVQIADHPLEAALVTALGISTAQSPLGAWNADADGDGLANALELLLGLDPAVPGGLAGAAAHEVVGGLSAFDFRISTEDYGLTWQAQYSEDLQNWSASAPSANGGDSEFDYFRVEMPTSAPRLFHRLAISRP